jgi:hypothetical protein
MADSDGANLLIFKQSGCFTGQPIDRAIALVAAQAPTRRIVCPKNWQG